MTIKQIVMKAWAETARVEIVLESGDTERGYIQNFTPNVLLHGVANEPIEYDDIADVRFVGEEAGSEQRVTPLHGPWSEKKSVCGCFHHSDMSDYSCERKDCPLNSAEPPASDTASERWEWRSQFPNIGKSLVCMKQGEHDLFLISGVFYGTDEQRQVMTKAPELADKLNEIVYMSSVCTPEGEAHTLPILRETLWEAHQLLVKVGHIDPEEDEDE